jgi:protein gp37
MAETQIEWTDSTWNPVAGCSIITAGCTHCYAMEMAKRLEAMGIEKYSGLTRKTGKRTVWNGVVREDREALAIPYGWKKPRKIFVNSMSDLFHEGVSDKFILRVWNVMRETPRHNYQILTKRPERMASLVASQICDVLPNVWLGTSIENAEVVSRIDHLRQAPAAIRFISFEPLIGSVGVVDLSDIHWAIVGGESGKSARPIKEEWIR